MCSPSGGQNCIIQHLVSSHSAGGRPVHGTATCRAVSCNYVERGVYHALYLNDCLFSFVITTYCFVIAVLTLVLRNVIAVKLDECFFMVSPNLDEFEFKNNILFFFIHTVRLDNTKDFLDVLLTVHLSIILVTNQLNAQILVL